MQGYLNSKHLTRAVGQLVQLTWGFLVTGSDRCKALRLLLSCYLAELHGGQISIQGTPESGYRYVASLPELVAVQESL